MRIGVPREVKDHEYRVGVMPAGAAALAAGLNLAAGKVTHAGRAADLGAAPVDGKTPKLDGVTWALGGARARETADS